MEIRFALLPLPNHYTAPAHPHATDAAVYTALLFKFRGLKKKRESDGQTDGSMDTSKKGLEGFSGNLYIYSMTRMVR